MTKVRVHNFCISLDGYGAGPNQSFDNPLGEGAMSLHKWFVATKTWNELHGSPAGEETPDERFAARATENVGAEIMGRNKFGPYRGPWENDEWKGWWGDNPPFHTPVFVLTHFPREPIEMEGGTTFYFVDEGIESALKQATEAADGKDVVIGGGAATIRSYLRARLIDEMHVAVSPVTIGGGEHLFEDLDGAMEDYELVNYTGNPSVAHYEFAKK